MDTVMYRLLACAMPDSFHHHASPSYSVLDVSGHFTCFSVSISLGQSAEMFFVFLLVFPLLLFPLMFQTLTGYMSSEFWLSLSSLFFFFLYSYKYGHLLSAFSRLDGCKRKEGRVCGMHLVDLNKNGKHDLLCWYSGGWLHKACGPVHMYSPTIYYPWQSWKRTSAHLISSMDGEVLFCCAVFARGDLFSATISSIIAISGL